MATGSLTTELAAGHGDSPEEGPRPGESLKEWIIRRCRELKEIKNEPVPWDKERVDYLKEIYWKFVAESLRRIRAEGWKNAKAAAVHLDSLIGVRSFLSAAGHCFAVPSRRPHTLSPLAAAARAALEEGARRAAAARGERGAALAEGLRRQVEERRARLAAERAAEAVEHESPRARRSLLQCCRCSRCLPAGRFSANPYRMPHPVSAAAAAEPPAPGGGGPGRGRGGRCVQRAAGRGGIPRPRRSRTSEASR
eukprot:tig00001222_g7611.t1